MKLEGISGGAEKDEAAAAKDAAAYEREAKAFVMRQVQKDFHGKK